LVKDRFGKEVDNLRLAVTGRCNLACFFCHHEGYTPNICSAGAGKEMSPGEIRTVVEVAAGQGINRVKLTGGEPLLREDLGQIIKEVGAVAGIGEVSLVTNGVLLEERVGDLEGVSRINVSIHTTQPNIYRKITGRDLHGKVLKGIEATVKAGLPVKLNMTVLKGLNEDEVEGMVELAKRMGTDLQLIEYHSPEMDGGKFVNLDKVEKWLDENSEKKSELKDNRRKRFEVKGVKVHLVRPMFNREFCENCHRMRVTPDGKFKPCLMREDNHVEFDVMSRESVEKAFGEAIKRKEPFFR